MEYSIRYRDTMNSLFRANFNTKVPVRDVSSFEHNNSYNMWVEISKHITNGMVEVPTCLVGFYRYLDSANVYDKIIIPVLHAPLPLHVSGAESALREFSNSHLTDGLLEVQTSKGEKYYGCRGLIFDKDMNLLFMTAAQGILESGKYSFNKRVVYLHPKVFTNDSAIINKSLAKKALSYYLSIPSRRGYSGTDSSLFKDEYFSEMPIIKIEDKASLFKLPKKPINPTKVTRDINKFIRLNIDDILKQVEDDIR